MNRINSRCFKEIQISDLIRSMSFTVKVKDEDPFGQAYECRIDGIKKMDEAFALNANGISCLIILEEKNCLIINTDDCLVSQVFLIDDLYLIKEDLMDDLQIDEDSFYALLVFLGKRTDI